MAEIKKVTKRNHLPEKENDRFPVYSKQFNDLVDHLNGGTGDLSVNDLTVAGTTTLNGSLVLGDAAADALTINATTTLAEPINYSNATGITAGTTQTQGGATALTEEFNNVTTVGTAGDGVSLPAAVAGKRVVIKNSGANVLAIYPASADSIDALAVNLAVFLAPDSTAVFNAKDAIVWESTIDKSLTLNAPTTSKGQLRVLAADSAGNTVTTITNASQAAARIYTIPDAGADGNFVLTNSIGATLAARCTAQIDATSGTTGTTLTNITGLSVSVLASGVYSIKVYLAGTSTVNSGLKLAVGGTATATSISYTGRQYNGTTLNANTTPVTSLGSAVAAATTVYTYAEITGTIVVNAAGTITIQFAQNASHADTTSVYVNSHMLLTRIA